jgi:Ca-activated chloride channel family protein
MPGTAQAAESDWWRRADQREHTRIEQGADAYRKGDYSAAEQAFSGIDSADAWYNQANALAKQGKYDEAIDAYDRALKQRPEMEDAIENRKVVDAARKRKPQGGQNQNQNQGQGKQQDQQQKSSQTGEGKTEPKQQAADARDKAQNAPQTPPKNGAGKTPEPPRTPQQQAADAKAQQAADAAQRQRMQQAMAQGKQPAQAGKNDAQAAPATETPEQRERRQAVEAWLRRVPDEPGGLLKTKFQLEYERRQKEGQ